MNPPEKALKLIGTKINKWSVIEYIGRGFLKVICECGNTSRATYYDLLENKSKQCKSCRSRSIERWPVSPFGSLNPNWKGTRDIPLDYFSQIKRGAEARNVSFNLTIEDFQTQWDKQKGLCAYTGRSMHFKKDRKNRKGRHDASSTMASLDRIDNSLPYDVNNIQFIVAPLNLMKSSYTESEFFDLLKEIIQYKQLLTKP